MVKNWNKKLYLFISHLDVAALLDEVTSKQWVKHRVDTLLNILNQNYVSGHDGVFDPVKVSLSSQPNNN